MSGTFVVETDIERDELDWGEIGWISRPSFTGAANLVVMDLTLEPGFGHDFHKHPGQEEVIYVRSGRIQQWLERESKELSAGDAVFIPEDLVHASFNVGDETAKLTVMLGPSVGEGGYVAVEVAAEEPWASVERGS